MKDYLNDLRKYYLLYLILLIGLIFVSTISHVFLVKFIRLPWYDFDVLLIFVLPFLLTIFSVYKILKQKFDEIEPTNIQTKLNIKSFFTFLLVLPIIASQYYIDARLNRMIDINSVSNIKDYPTDKYFKIHEYNIDKTFLKLIY